MNANNVIVPFDQTYGWSLSGGTATPTAASAVVTLRMRRDTISRLLEQRDAMEKELKAIDAMLAAYEAHT